ncbi:MAG: hypothetical protein CFH10_00609 [Alphaproteobacteria bacterium MarineAlpha4_Bin2]|nr:MAG: hypothetical protein CFH10_00609 [Alphaproteobacteria bacterium MarineAlpha4_Bin2]
MPLQNRMTPKGDIEADTARGYFLGNRGVLHDANKRLGQRRWAHDNWIICWTEFRGHHREVMSPGRYTELFFLDEAVAIAAGHRPCYKCRRQDYQSWTKAWQIAHKADEKPGAKEMDQALHRERIDRATWRQKTWRARLDDLPDGTFITWKDAPHLVSNRSLLRWSHGAYTEQTARSTPCEVEVLTPPISVKVLTAGFRPHLHHSVNALKIC